MVRAQTSFKNHDPTKAFQNVWAVYNGQCDFTPFPAIMFSHSMQVNYSNPFEEAFVVRKEVYWEFTSLNYRFHHVLEVSVLSEGVLAPGGEGITDLFQHVLEVSVLTEGPAGGGITDLFQHVLEVSVLAEGVLAPAGGPAPLAGEVRVLRRNTH